MIISLGISNSLLFSIGCPHKYAIVAFKLRINSLYTSAVSKLIEGFNEEPLLILEGFSLEWKSCLR
jgi:hypothetical protein